MNYEFNQEINRRNTGAIKWEVIQELSNPETFIKTDAYFGEDRILPMWVADMDLACPESVQNALQERAKHPIYGYTMADDDYYKAVQSWMDRRLGWDIKKEWIVTTPGVIPALHLLVRTFTSPGQKVLVQRPVYYPFFSSIEDNQRHVVSNSLVLEDGKYVMDFDDLEEKTADPQVTMAILCSPHNPVGRVWSKKELERFTAICQKNHVFIVADEIHGDIIYPGYQFTTIGNVEGEVLQDCAICTSSSKTFNLAGLLNSNIIIPNANLREKFKKSLKKIGYIGPSPFAIAACKAAYNDGEDWLEKLLAHLDSNAQLLKDEFVEHIPHIPVINPEGTYLMWFDCRTLNLDYLELRTLMLEKARVFMDEGYIFGPEGKGFERINIACPQPVLHEAIIRISNAILSL